MKELIYKICGNNEEITTKFNPELTGDITYHHNGDCQSMKCGEVTVLETCGVSFIVIKII